MLLFVPIRREFIYFGAPKLCVDVDFCKVKGAETSEVTAQVFEKDIPDNRKRAVCDGFSGPRFEEGPEDTPMWPYVIPTITKAQSNEFIIPDGFGSIRDIIEKSVNKHDWIHLEGYNDNGSPPIILTGST